MRIDAKSVLIGIVALAIMAGSIWGWRVGRMKSPPIAELNEASGEQQLATTPQGGGADQTHKQSLTTPGEQEKTAQEVLLPLTNEERTLNASEVILNQPDFVAELSFFRSEEVSGSGGSMRIARKGNRYREESQHWIFIGEDGKPQARLYPENKTYNDLERVKDQSESGSHPFNPRTLALEPDITFELVGAVIIDGHRCIKIKAKRKARSKEIYLYAAQDLKNLILIAQVLNPPYSFVQRLSNIFLEVPSNLIEIPRDYKPIERDRWTKVENARVTYKGKASKDYGIFRAPGGELFIWVNDVRHHWHYLVRPQEASVETAFHVLLVTTSGKFIWRTKETEAFSPTYYRDRKREVHESYDEERVIVTSNSVKFRSNDYNRDRAVIEVRW